MKPNRRDFLRLLLASSASLTLDVEKLLWIPGEKTIFLPSVSRLTDVQILAIELEIIIPKLRSLFERDSFFYKAIKDGNYGLLHD